MKYYTRVGDREREFTFERRGKQLIAHANGQSYRLDVSMVGDGNAFSLLVDGRSYDVTVDAKEGRTNVLVNGDTVQVHVEDERERTASAVASPIKPACALPETFTPSTLPFAPKLGRRLRGSRGRTSFHGDHRPHQLSRSVASMSELIHERTTWKNLKDSPRGRHGARQ